MANIQKISQNKPKSKNLRIRYTKKLQKANLSDIRQKSGPDSRCPLTYQNLTIFLPCCWRIWLPELLTLAFNMHQKSEARDTRNLYSACDSWRQPPLPPQIRGKPRQCALPRNATAQVAGLGYRRLRDCAAPQLVTHILLTLKPTAIAVGYRNIAPHGACR